MAQLPKDSETELVLAPGYTYQTATAHLADTVLSGDFRWRWYLGFGVGFLLVTVLLVAVTYLLVRGVGIWGIQIPVAWGYAITNFVWWIGIGHAGTFISAFLLLMRQDWRASINRFAEAMTLFAVASAGMFPLLHLGRPWYFFWLLPYPDTMDLWPQFRSPLIWDIFAVSTYLTVSLLFWYAGLIPDMASMRERAQRPWVKRAYGILSLGWRGSATHWRRYSSAYLLMAGLATPLVLSVHSVVSFDFTIAIVPGWHSTIFPPYFVAGAIFSGFAMVLTLAIPLRKYFGLKDFITLKHLENCAKLTLVTGLIVAYSYIQEAFMTWYGNDKFDIFNLKDRAVGHYAPIYWVLVVCNVLVPQLLWFKKVRVTPAWLLIVSILINIGMWSERFIIVVQSLSKDFLPSSWHLYTPTIWDWLTLAGSLGFFIFSFFLFIRLLPTIAISELRELVHKQHERTGESGA